MSVNIKTPEGLMKISGDKITKSKIVSALGYTPADETHTHTIADVINLQTTLDAKADQTDLESHIANTSNPHNVTASQVGLENVDNTSDVDKPVSTAQQEALDSLESKLNESMNETRNTFTSLIDGSEEFANLSVADGGILKFNTINAPTSSGGTVYGSGSSGQVLKSNGTTIYWASDSGHTHSADDILYESDGISVTSKLDDLQVQIENKANITDIPDYITTGAKSGTTIGTYATAEGYNTTASAQCSHAEGYNTTASSNHSHAEGAETTASGMYSHAEGDSTTASGIGSHAEGSHTTASGDYSHAEGAETTASGICSHASGTGTTALDYQFVLGKYNNADTTSIDGVGGVSSPDSQSSNETLFVVGYGTSTASGNAFRIAANGKCRGVSTFTASGADFAELFEWVDGNPNNEDRRGLFVTLDGEKIKIANNGDDYIGVISGAEAFLGNSASEEWQGKYLTDVFGTRLVQTVEIPAKIDEVTNKVITPAHTVTQYVLNPDYNPNEQYIMRENRKEWGMVGLLGQVVVIDDGTCVVGGYVKPSTNGIGTASDNGYRVMKRIDENHIKVLVK